MKARTRNDGVVLMLTVFVIALLSAMVMGLLQLNTLDIQIMSNHVHAANALAIAYAGLNDAFAEIRVDSGWTDGFTDKAFSGGSYSVLVTTIDPDTGEIPPDVTDGELDVVALGPLYPGVTQSFSVSHPPLTGEDFDSRTNITITAGSYTYNGGMSGSPFLVSVPLDANEISFKFVMKIQDYPDIPANVNCQVSWSLDDEPARSTFPTIISEGTCAEGYKAKVSADITIGRTAPYSISINRLRINE